MDDLNILLRQGPQLLMCDTSHDDRPCIGSTLDLMDGQLWFASEKRYLPGQTAEFSIRLGWKRRITCTLKVTTVAEWLASDFAYCGEFVAIDPTDFEELYSIMQGGRTYRDVPVLKSSLQAPAEAYCAAA